MLLSHGFLPLVSYEFLDLFLWTFPQGYTGLQVLIPLLTTGELAHFLSSDAALVSRPCFSNSGLVTLDLVMFYCQTFPWGLEHRTRRWTLMSQTHTFLLDWTCSSFLLGLRCQI